MAENDRIVLQVKRAQRGDAEAFVEMMGGS
jgi:hypothetical protein